MTDIDHERSLLVSLTEVNLMNSKNSMVKHWSRVNSGLVMIRETDISFPRLCAHPWLSGGNHRK